MVSTTANPDSELFCTVSSTQKVPERHPSTLIPGGHASPLRHPTVLRPGAGNHHARKSSSEAPKSPAQNNQKSPSTTPKPTYKAYSPPATPQDPRASVVAEEIEGFFTALDIQPLQIKKQDTISSPSTASSGRTSPDIQRCASPPLPPKVKLEEPQQLSPPAEVSPASELETHAQDEESDSDLPPAYDESERVQPPPEKPAATATETQEPEEETASTPTLAGSAAMSAAKVGGSVAGVDTNEVASKDTTEEAKPEHTPAESEEPTTEEQQPTTQTPEPASPSDTSSPPPLPPRPAASTSTSSSPTTPQPDTPAQMPGAFPPPPKRTQSPHKGHSSLSSSSYSKMTYVPGAAATSATAVGAAVAIPSTDFAHGGLSHARKALGQRVSHLIDKAKEHHEARKAGAVTRGPAAEDGKKENVLVVAPMIGA